MDVSIALLGPSFRTVQSGAFIVWLLLHLPCGWPGLFLSFSRTRLRGRCATLLEKSLLVCAVCLLELSWYVVVGWLWTHTTATLGAQYIKFQWFWAHLLVLCYNAGHCISAKGNFSSRAESVHVKALNRYRFLNFSWQSSGVHYWEFWGKDLGVRMAATTRHIQGRIFATAKTM